MTDTPLVFETPQDIYAHTSQARSQGKRIALVPTMGALHSGHISLMEYGRQKSDLLVASIFVNPMQFNNKDDLARYPRTWEDDLDKCRRAGVDAIYAPPPEAVYPKGFQTTVSVGEMTRGLCGAFRPGHFDGVTTVVLKLFNAVRPHLAMFGEKDYQQLQVVKAMVRDLDLDVEVVGRPTVREEDGLALSSRNKHLSSRERQQALCLYRALTKAREMAQGGETYAAALSAAAGVEVEGAPDAKLEYLTVVDAQSLEPLESLDRPARMVVAAWLGKTRLIDNMALNY